MYKIQVRAIEKDGLPPPSESVRMWQDLVEMPELPGIKDAAKWLMGNDVTYIEGIGFQFRVIPVEGE